MASSNMQNTYFAWLPNEIILHILKNLEHFEILQFVEIFPEFTYQFRNLDLSRTMDYRIFDLKKWKKLIDLERITSLNINNVYWVSAADLRKLIKKMENLKSLYAIKTKLDLTKNDVTTYNHNKKIEKLAITCSYFLEADDDSIPSVRVLYIHLKDAGPKATWMTMNKKAPYKLVFLFPNLEKLWVEDQLFFARNLENYFKEYKKFFCKCVNYGGTRNTGGQYFDVTRGSVRIVCIENPYANQIDCKNLSVVTYLIGNHAAGTFWYSILQHLLRVPFSPYEIRDLILNKANLNNVQFKELNLLHRWIYSAVNDNDYHLSVSQMQRHILSSQNAETLRSLCFMTCVLVVFQGGYEQKSESDESGIAFKRPRIAPTSQTSSHVNQIIKSLFDSLSNLEELVICSCPCVSSFKIIGYNFISSCTNLKILNIEIPQGSDGEFFLPIFKECKFLELLKVHSPCIQSEQFNYNFLKAIPLANNLKHLYFKNSILPIEKFLTTLTTMPSKNLLITMPSKKLQRLVLACTEATNKILSTSLKALVAAFPHLILFVICIEKTAKTNIKTLERILKELTTHPAQTFVARQTIDTNSYFGIPEVHGDILDWEMGSSSVASINPLRDFEDF